ncbi:PatB family C-S lyase [Desulfuromonas carbonis]|uniref:MalY/PatB family protein n=1 Tax=Desulfuromonas sp. DDH964 TaxID=1823759 RepID=UPI00078C5A7C|nr:PatB family C-S lyase [Desulfuromonas sp. DDH964]AMV70551.1 amino acid aminotransferase [Desulfuromonas sp. DDH964]
MPQPLFDFDQLIDRRQTGSEKWNRYAGRDILPLWVADMDFAAPPAVLAALHERIDHGVFGYTAPGDGLRRAVIDHLQRDFAWQIGAEELVWLPGLVTGLNVLCRAVGERGDAVLTSSPIYPPFLSAPGLSERELLDVPLVLREQRWQFDFAAIEAAITPRTRLLLLCNPHNPVGRAWSRPELEALAEIARRHDLVIGSDDIHAGLVLNPEQRHIPIATLDPGVASRCITLLAPSKTYNIPGLGCSFAVISDPQLRKQFKQAMGRIVPHVNTLGLTAAEAAYRHGEPWRQELLAYLRGNHELVTQAIAAMPGLAMTPVEATCLAWIDTRARGLDQPGQFFEAAGVGLSDGGDFGAPGFVRLNFGCPRSLLVEALERMKKALG